MEIDRFLAKNPRVFHLAHGDAWPGIQQHGLLSAQGLVELFEREADADELLGQRRPEAVILEDEKHGKAVLRDQGPLNVEKLEKVLLDGMTVEGWLRLLNTYVFLFPNPKTLDVMSTAYESQPQLVLTMNTSSLFQEYGVWLKLAGINVGATQYNPAKRGRDTFLSVTRYDDKRPIKEIAIAGGIPDIRRHLLAAEHRFPDGTRETIAL